MLSPEERRLIAGILALLIVGAFVKLCRGRVSEDTIPKIALPAVDAGSKAPAKGFPKKK